MARRRSRTRRILAVVAGLLAVGLVVLALRPAPVPVEVAQADRGGLTEVVEGTGKVRVRERFQVSAPVSGQLTRVEVHVGDRVQSGQALASVEAPVSAPLDPRTRADLTGKLNAALAAESEARAALDRARVAARQADRDLQRARKVAEGGSLAPAELEKAEANARALREGQRMAEAALGQATSQVEAARAALGEGDRGSGPVEVTAPVDGTVLRVMRESGGPVAAGAPIVEVGDLKKLEVYVDLPSSDAVKVRRGQKAKVTDWGGGKSLEAVVREVEPAAYTKVSPLGVEEQRVNVLLDPSGEGWERLGDGYAAEVGIIVRQLQDVVRVPGSALFRTSDGKDALYLEEKGRARLVMVEVLGRSAGLAAIKDAVEPGARLIVHPGDQVKDGVRVAERK